MLLTPTYHVFEMFKVHQDSEALALALNTSDYAVGGDSIPQVSASASKRPDGTIDISLCNVDPNSEAPVTLRLRGLTCMPKVSGRLLTHADMNAHNTFEQPETVAPQAFDGVTDITAEGLSAKLPPMSVAVVTLRF